MRRLIINADDFGLTSGVNRAIVECHQAETVTSTTLMASGKAFDDAVAAASSYPTLRVGCHVMIVDGAPILSPLQTSSLLASGKNVFRTGIAGFAIQAVKGKFSSDEVFAETAAQIRKLQQSGIEVTHFDTHKHTHMFPQILRPMLQAAKECGVRAVRNPFAPVKAMLFANFMRRPRLWVRYSQVRWLRRYADDFEREIAEAGMRSTQGTFGIIATGAVTQELLDAIIGSVPEGTWELVCHPGYRDAELDSVNTRLRASREQERAALISENTKAALKKHGIDLISFADI